MLRNLRKVCFENNTFNLYYMQRKTFLTNAYKCTDAWNTQASSKILSKVNLNDFYNIVNQNLNSKGVISAIDVDVFANAIKDPVYLEELKDLLHKLRLSAETGNTLESTHQATMRNFIEFGHVQELLDILKDPLSFGIFLDTYMANILLDQLITSQEYENAATVASLVMLQEDFTHEITCALCQYASYKFTTTYTPKPEPPPTPDQKNKKVEEIKIRIKYLRNPFFDDHFDTKDTLLLAGKTLAWISEKRADNLSNNLQIIGWLFYRKYDKLLSVVENVSKSITSKVFKETLELMKKECQKVEGETKEIMEKCISKLSKLNVIETPIEESIKNLIENAINKLQNNDITQQKQLFDSWIKVREVKLEEQIKRLDRAKRIELIEQKQKQLTGEEQRLWFFENEEALDLQIEEKEKLQPRSDKKKPTKESEENYIPPEILPKRK